MRRLLALVPALLLLGACGAPDPDLVGALEDRIEHLEATAATERASYERQIGDLQETVDRLSAENAELQDARDTFRTISGSDGSVERHLGMLEQQIDACHETLDRYRADLDRCLAGGGSIASGVSDG